MRVDHLETKHRGWFVGDFPEASLRTKAAEVAVKRYGYLTQEDWHVHREATEVTLILEGLAQFEVGPKVGKKTLVVVPKRGIMVLEPGEGASFTSLCDGTVTVVFKTPSLPSDKYLE